MFVGDGVPVSRSINRNIVECKGKNDSSENVIVSSVLIETLWNVKSEAVKLS